MLVEPQQLVRIGLGARAADGSEVEEGADLLHREDLLIPVGPADTDQPVADRFRQVPLVPEVLHRHRIASLAELLASLADDQRNVREERRLLLERAVEPQLEGGVAVVVGPADHVGDPHVEIVDHHRQVVEGLPVAALDVHVADLAHVLSARPEDQVVPLQPSLLGQPQPHRVGPALLPQAEVATAAVVHPAATRGQRLAAPLLQLRGRAAAAVGVAAGQQLLDGGGVELAPLALAQRPLVPVDAEPAEGVEQRLLGLPRRALAIGVLDAQDQAAAVAAREGPVEQRRADGSDVQRARGARCEAGARAAHAGREYQRSAALAICRPRAGLLLGSRW